MSIRPGITISIQDVDESFWEETITYGEGRFAEEITLENLYQLFKERLEQEGGSDDEEDEGGDTEEEGDESDGAVQAEPWIRY
jgi:hypothetical protein